MGRVDNNGRRISRTTLPKIEANEASTKRASDKKTPALPKAVDSLLRSAAERAQQILAGKVDHFEANSTRTSRSGAGGSTVETKKSTESSSKLEQGTFRVHQGVDWSKSASTQGTFSKEIPLNKDGGETAAKPKGQKALDVLGKVLSGVNVQGTLVDGSFDNSRTKTILSGSQGSISTSVATSGAQKVAFEADGLNASFNRQAVAGISGQASGSTSGKYGTASYDAAFAAEAKAWVDAQAHADANGLNASLHAGASASVEASATGRLESTSVTIAGVDMNAYVEGTVTASAEASAEANATVTVTRKPPQAVIEGSVGASAVAKIEGEVTASAGPFEVTAQGYLSAGAEATASGGITFKDGKLTIQANAGAAVGVGAGGTVNLTVDVEMIGEMAMNAADVNNDGMLGLDDLSAAATNVRSAVMNTADLNNDGRLGLDDVGAAASKVGDAIKNTADVNNDGKLGFDDVGAAAANVGNAARAAVADVVNSGAKKVLGWLGF